MIDDEFDVTQADVVVPLEQKPQRNVSKQFAKRLRNLHSVAINQMTNGQERTLKQLEADLAETRAKLSTASLIVEALCTRFGPQTFERDSLRAQHAGLAFDTSPTRITVSVRPPMVIEDGQKAT
jgi:hypothetical protein